MAIILASPFAFADANYHDFTGDGFFGDARGGGQGMHEWAGKSQQFELLGSDSTEDGDGYGYGSMSPLSCFTFLACTVSTDLQAVAINIFARMEP
jgi:hypothetical protein